MTQVIFVEWLWGLHVRKGNVILVMDSCSAHIPLMQLASVGTMRNTTVFYLPLDTPWRFILAMQELSKASRIAIGAIQSPSRSAHLGQGCIPREERRTRGYAYCCWSLGHGCEAKNNPQLMSSVQNSHHRCCCDTCPGWVAFWPWSNKGPGRAVSVLHYWNLMDIRNLINYPAEREAAYCPTQKGAIPVILLECCGGRWSRGRRHLGIHSCEGNWGTAVCNFAAAVLDAVRQCRPYAACCHPDSQGQDQHYDN